MGLIKIVGAGLAGCEAAFQLASLGHLVEIYEVKTLKPNPIQKTNNFAELVCSNTFRSKSTKNAVGILKEELKLMNSLILKVAFETEIPSDDALAVDRDDFSKKITNIITNHPNIKIINQEFVEIKEDEITIIASGPLTTPNLQEQIAKITGKNKLFFLDASAPIITKDSINFEKVYWASRHGENNGEYICVPLEEDQFEKWYQELITASTTDIHDFEKEIFFQGCQPIEVLGKKGRKNLLNGPMSPNKLINPRTNNTPFSVLQLRQDNAIDSLYNIVGFQTNLKWPEQKRIIQMLPGLENAEIVRYGVMHKNNYINSPKILNSGLQVMRNKNIFFAGQITGVEGYLESAASGVVVAMAVNKFINKSKFKPLPKETVLGSLIDYITNSQHKKLKPMKANLGILPALDKVFENRSEKNLAFFHRAIEQLKLYLANN
ncbi:methylenetetrahydrofolate--tRNA-(uracil(54)-C(5))-methyltransferase (FADH(2)-oxidizing) TrmFO [Spiroplasma alleghenense]|uniref:Methylenetetrahydrofolate--tRNA-(uracil-5-)-methyltransferase TrmFO n=1 Tax=Spiroplasma alleghenense TaxID=216931 RepID=A0A345Z3Z9_9MOLU|nr:methylenetetrahydrofolate--tRNA-(uracil(54)-C(5))-methyltransferase (FADH(2)-oxidizing) TrmFO [Spiroplasma alleghenense]AXK51328.1 tRNA (uracil-5-)-methyltransferase Gid [Spiroplasma alleghenense]